MHLPQRAWAHMTGCLRACPSGSGSRPMVSGGSGQSGEPSCECVPPIADACSGAQMQLAGRAARREEEVAVVARLQAQAFHEASSFAPLDSLLYYVFQVGDLQGSSCSSSFTSASPAWVAH
jgi:hypothetical protein